MIEGIGGSGFSYNNMMLAPMGQFKPPQFEELDVNQDGGIDTVEFKSFTDKLAAGGPADGLFAKIDTNGDSIISQEEMQIAEEKHRQRAGQGPGPAGGMGEPNGSMSLPDLLKSDDDEDDGTLFSALDTNKNGKLEENELQSGMIKLLQKFQNTAYEQPNRTDNESNGNLDLSI